MPYRALARRIQTALEFKPEIDLNIEERLFVDYEKRKMLLMSVYECIQQMNRRVTEGESNPLERIAIHNLETQLRHFEGK